MFLAPLFFISGFFFVAYSLLLSKFPARWKWSNARTEACRVFSCSFESGFYLITHTHTDKFTRALFKQATITCIAAGPKSNQHKLTTSLWFCLLQTSKSVYACISLLTRSLARFIFPLFAFVFDFQSIIISMSPTAFILVQRSPFSFILDSIILFYTSHLISNVNIRNENIYIRWCCCVHRSIDQSGILNNWKRSA